MRAAYFYNYMTLAHLDTLAAAGFNRAVIRIIGDSLGARSAPSIGAWIGRGEGVGIQVVPDWLFQSRGRLEAQATSRRYVWGAGTREEEIACPVDSAYWRSALLDRAEEVIRAAPGVGAVAVDFEIHAGGRKYYDAGPCRCTECLREYTGSDPIGGAAAAWRLSGLLSYQESRITYFVSDLLAEFARRHPGVEVGVFDLDLDSFVHRALARALARAQIPTTDYCERSYSTGGGPLRGARARLDALGLGHASLVGGLWLKRFTPRNIVSAARSVLAQGDGFFVFTTFSLCDRTPSLTGPYTLLGSPTEYWRRLKELNHRDERP